MHVSTSRKGSKLLWDSLSLSLSHIEKYFQLNTCPFEVFLIDQEEKLSEALDQYTGIFPFGLSIINS